MNICEIIFKTKRKEKLNEDEIKCMINGYVNDEIPDYQMSAWLMAVCFNSLTTDETLVLTETMKDSGDILDLSSIHGITVDKHSTGGVGDKTSLVIAPICASCGIYVPKMSGRGLGFTGGTIDKLESIPGFQVNIDFNKYIDIINKNGAAIIAQSGHLVPADKKLYALRDVTATVDSIPLICSSIMSKKLARCRAIITDMNEPLGNAIGNSLEVIEVCEILSGREKGKLYELCIALAANMMELGGLGSLEDCTRLAEDAITSGRAIDTFKKMIEAQGGNPNITEDYSLFKRAAYKCELKAEKSGYISSIDSEKIGMVALLTGAGRRNKNDSSAGIILNKHVGDCVDQGDVIMTFYSSVVKNFDEVINKAADAVEISGIMPKISPVVIKII